MPQRGSGTRRGRGGQYDFSSFLGYRGPRFTPIPDEFLDHQLADLTSAEAKVMLFLFRKTYGYRKSADRVSFAQLEHGTMSSDGTIIDRGTGLSKATIWRALKGLQKKGLIEVRRQRTPAGDADVNYYRIREFQGSEGENRSSNPRPSSGPPASPSAPPGPAQVLSAPSQGSYHSETTPVSERNDPGFRSERPRGFRIETTREDATRKDSTRRDYTLTRAIADLAAGFLRSIGYRKPARAKSERTVQILRDLTDKERYDLDDLRTACAIAVSMGARGPELIPHVIGKTPPVGEEVGEKFARLQEEDRRRWEDLSDAFDALPPQRREELLISAQRSNPILAERLPDHPLIRAAAIGLLAKAN
jgi:hypothetical protein